MTKRHIALISTGGTIEKTYDELQGVLDNANSVLDVLLAGLQLGGVDIVRVPLLNKDSLEMTVRDHALDLSICDGEAAYFAGELAASAGGSSG